MDKIQIELDVVDVDGDGLAGLVARSAEAGVAVEVITMEGPAGGNPLVKVTGLPVDVDQWLRLEYGEEDQGERDLLGQYGAKKA